MPPWEFWAPAIVAIGGVIGAVAVLLKALAEIRVLKQEQGRASADQSKQLDKLQKAQAQSLHELQPNSGGSMRDSVTRMEGMMTTMTTDMTSVKGALANVQSDLARHDKEIGRANDTITTTLQQTGAIGERLAMADAEDRRRAESEHQRLRDEVNQRLDSMRDELIEATTRGA